MPSTLTPIEQQRQRAWQAARRQTLRAEQNFVPEDTNLPPAEQLARKYASGPIMQTGSSMSDQPIEQTNPTRAESPATQIPNTPISSNTSSTLGQSQQTAQQEPRNQQGQQTGLNRSTQTNSGNQGLNSSRAAQQSIANQGIGTPRNSVGGGGKSANAAGTETTKQNGAAQALRGRSLDKSGGKNQGTVPTQQKNTVQQTSGNKNIDSLKMVLMILLLIFATLIDLLNLLALGAIIDWIADAIFFVAVFIVTFDGLGSAFMKRQITNFIGMVAEFIPIVGMLPFHMLVVILIYLDMKTGIISKVTSAKSLSPATK